MAKDPYRYFRLEAREILEGLQRGIASLDTGGRLPDQIALLLRLAHTLKGAARVVRLAAVSQLAHQLEEVLEPFREGQAAPGAEPKAELHRLTEAIAAGLTAIDQPAPEPVAPAPTGATPSPLTIAPSPALLDTVRLQVAEVDGVMTGITDTAKGLAVLRADFRRFEATTRQARLLQALAGRGQLGTITAEIAARLQTDVGDLVANIETVRQSVGSRVERVTRDLQRLHEKADNLRLLPAEALWAYLDSTVRDAAQTLGKHVRLEVSSRTPRLDTPVFAGLQEALLHLVRNAVAHGIEPEPVRIAAGKPAEGLIRLRIEHGIGRLRIICDDDGGGIDVEAVRRAAVAKGRRTTRPDAPMDMTEAIRYLLQGGVSTTAAASQISGRGVGLDAVKAATVRLGGEMTLNSVPQRGTTVVLDIPVLLSSVETLAMESNGATLMLPLDSVRRVVRVETAAIRRIGTREELHLDQEVVPFTSLHRFVPAQTQGQRPTRSHVQAIILQGAQHHVALGVDRLLGVMEAVVRPLPALADAAPYIAGASPGAGGIPRLLLDARALAAAVESALAEGGMAAAKRLPLLVVDDSLTTRMLEKSILESAGYTVDIAVSGEDALVRLRERRYGLMLVDVEMPGMDGFTVIEHIRRDPQLRDLPAIMVTSRESREDRQRGLAAGAQDYVVKGDFDQRRLLQRIRELLT